MATLDEISQEKQKLAERLTRIDADRAKVAQQLEELEIAERVLSRFGGQQICGAAPTRAARTSYDFGYSAERPSRSAKQPQSTLSLSDATMKAIEANGGGATAAEVMTYLTRELGMSVRPNHLGIALQRHRRAGRLENRDQRWYLPQSQGNTQSAMAG